MLDLSDIGISTGAFAELPLAAALLRIAELAPAAEVFSYGHHSLLEPGNARAVAAAGLPFSVHGPFTHFEFATTSNGKHRAAVDLHRRHMEVAAELGAFLYIVHPDLHRRPRPWNPKIAAALERSFDELRRPAGRARPAPSPSRTCRSPSTRTSRRPATSTCGALAWSSIPATPPSPARWPSGSTTRRPACATSISTTTPGSGDDDRHQPVGSGVVDAGPVLAAARAAGATIALELTNEADVLASLDYLRTHDLLVAPGVG